METKKCTCEKPDVRQSLPEGFSGTIKCAKCEGLATYPRPKETYKGTDPVEGYLFNLDSNNKGMSYEKAVLTMLIRIEKALKQLQNTGRK